MKKVLSIILTASILLSLWGATTVLASNDLNIVWIGGSFTEGTTVSSPSNNFVSLVGDYFTAKYPGVNVNNYNEGIGGTTSIYGRFRLEKDVVSKNPDIVFVEFAGNDSIVARKDTVILAMESIVRRLQSLPKEVKIVFLYRPKWSPNHTALEWHKEVAKYYNVNEIDTKTYVENLAASGEFDLSDLVAFDNVHPNDLGHYYIAQGIIESIEKNGLKASDKRAVPMSSDYKAFIPQYINAVDNTSISGNWETRGETDLYTEAADASITFNFSGTSFALVAQSHTQEDYTQSIVIDGKNYFAYMNYASGMSMFYGTINGLPDGEHTAVITNGEGHKLQIRAIIVDGIANSGMTTTEKTDYYSYFDSFLNEETTSFGQIPAKEGRITHPNSQINGGLSLKNYYVGWRNSGSTNEVSLTYHLTPAQITEGLEMHSFTLKTFKTTANETRTPDESIDIGFWAVDAANNKIPVTNYMISDNGYTQSGWREDTWIGYNLPPGTVKIETAITTANVQTTRILGFSYLYAVPTMDRVNVTVPEGLIAGIPVSAEVKGYLSNGAQADLTGATYEFYSTDEDVFTVNAETGEITPLNAGRAELYVVVTTAEGTVYERKVDIRVISADSVENIRLRADKYTYTKGTSGKIDICALVNGEEKINELLAEFSSDNSSVVSINPETGSFVAKAAGTATIGASVLGFDNPEPIVITVKESTAFEHDIYNDYTADPATFPTATNWSNRATTFAGAKIYTWGCSLANNMSVGASGAKVLNEASNTQMFIYKLDGGIEEIRVKTSAWSGYTDRVKFYFTDGEEGEVNGKKIDNPQLNYWDTNSYCFSATPRTPDKIQPWWNEVEPASAGLTASGSPSEYTYVISDIPEGSKYMLIATYTVAYDSYSEAHGQTYHLKNVKYQTKPYVIAHEFLDADRNSSPISRAKKLALTFDRSVSEVTSSNVDFKLNGEQVEVSGTYDAATYTYYMNLPAVAAEDEIIITLSDVTDTDGLSVEYEGSFTVDDIRGQIANVEILDQLGQPAENLYGMTSATVNASVTNMPDGKIMFAVAHKGPSSGQLDYLKGISAVFADVVNGTAQIEGLTLNISNADEGDYLKVYVWTDSMSPVPNYRNLATAVDYNF